MRILNAALDEFARKGVAGARVANIVKKANVSQQLLYHYYGSKKRMYRAVIERIFQITTERCCEDFTDLGEEMNRLYDFALEQRAGSRLLFWEAVETNGIHFAGEESRIKLHRFLQSRISLLQSSDRVRTELDPGMVAITLMGMAELPLTFPAFVRLTLGMSPDDPRFIMNWKAHMSLIGSLMSVPETDLHRLVDSSATAESNRRYEVGVSSAG